ncbi:pilus assembly protein PilP [Azohydromonas aeria]|uniref:pilus assembly protein PilP n=1 Tax=Azohydromonas aeria TaxID=2590212 RepID=UPI0012FC91A9|nr:pilus assembly protein PilP [Azohydromonas aeria]
MTTRPAAVLLALLGAALLSACQREPDDLRDWIAAQRQAASAPTLPPLALSGLPALPAWDSDAGPDPFDPRRLEPNAATAAAAASEPGALPATEQRRTAEPLEAYPLESLRMVGTLQRGGRIHALVQAPGLLLAVQPGDHLGTNRGRITRITEKSVQLREWVRDSGGGWSERGATLELQEASR